MRRLFNISFFLLIAVVISIPHTAGAVQVFLDTAENERNEADTFYVPVRIDTQNDCINTVKVEIAYNPNEISIQDIGIGDSILTLWTQFPVIQKNEGKEIGRVLFEGGIPGGYCGRVIGDPGLTNILAKLVVTGVPHAQRNGSATTTQIVVGPETKVYLHDGIASEAPLTVLGVELALAYSTSSPNNVWLSDIKKDVIAPELFEITLVEGPSVGSDRHYIVFNTTDKQSGIDHYEVLETDPDKFGFLTWISKKSYWIVATSPYTLRDQALHSKILVKAMDKNGNERIVTYTPPMSPFVALSKLNALFVLIAGVLVVLFSIILFILLRKKKKIKKKEKLKELIEENYE